MSACCKRFSLLCVILAMASIIGSVGIWYLSKGTDVESVAHAERFGIFVGLWAPTFLGLANYTKSCGTCSSEKKSGCCNS